MYPSLCMNLYRQRTNFCFLLLKGSQDCVSAPELCFMRVHPLLVFCNVKKKKNPLLLSMLALSQFLFFLSLGTYEASYSFPVYFLLL